MLSNDQKKEYMEIMHEFAGLRSELEALQYNKNPQVTAADDSGNGSNSNSVTADPVAVNAISPDSADRLSQLRAQLQS